MDLSLFLLIFSIGAIIGSFVNVIIYRIPKKISLFYPKSSCVKCANQLSWYENVPIISYLFLLGKCKHCQAKISIIYPLIEGLLGFAFVIIYFYEQNILHFIYLSFLVSMFISLSIIDFKHFILPDKLLIVTAIVSVAYYVYLDGLLVLNNFLSAFISFSVLYTLSIVAKKIFKKDSLGMGDLKLGALIGFLIGWKSALIAIYFGFILAGIIILVLYLIKGVKRNSYLPFGPFMFAGMFIYALWGQQIIQWYLHFVTHN